MTVLRFPLERCVKPHLHEQDKDARKAEIHFFPGVRYSALENPSARQTKQRKVKSRRKSN